MKHYNSFAILQIDVITVFVLCSVKVQAWNGRKGGGIMADNFLLLLHMCTGSSYHTALWSGCVLWHPYRVRVKRSCIGTVYTMQPYLSCRSALTASNSSVLSTETGHSAGNILFYSLVSRIWRMATLSYKMHNRRLATFEIWTSLNACGLLMALLWYPLSCASLVVESNMNN